MTSRNQVCKFAGTFLLLDLNVLAQFLRIETQDRDGRSMLTGKAIRVEGRQAHIDVKGSVNVSAKVLSVTTVGKGTLTAAEAWREDVVLKALQGGVDLMQYPFFCSIWVPWSKISWPPVQNVSAKPLIYCEGYSLNPSQEKAVQRIVSEENSDRVVLIQGPPGTGKTTVIATSVVNIIDNRSEDTEGRAVWLVAHSNIAVKNMAEKLDKVEFRDFRLLVSKDFHFDWYVTHHTPLFHTEFSMTGIHTCMIDWNIVLYDPTRLIKSPLPPDSVCSTRESCFARLVCCPTRVSMNIPVSFPYKPSYLTRQVRSKWETTFPCSTVSSPAYKR